MKKKAPKKKNLKEIKIHMGLFDYSINVAIGDYKHLAEYVANKFEDKLSVWEERLKKCTPRGQYHIKDGYCPIIWLPRIPKTIMEHGTLAHEASHIMIEVMHWAGMKINFETDEVFAHGIAHIVRSILKGK